MRHFTVNPVKTKILQRGNHYISRKIMLLLTKMSRIYENYLIIVCIISPVAREFKFSHCDNYRTSGNAASWTWQPHMSWIYDKVRCLHCITICMYTIVNNHSTCPLTFLFLLYSPSSPFISVDTGTLTGKTQVCSVLYPIPNDCRFGNYKIIIFSSYKLSFYGMKDILLRLIIVSSVLGEYRCWTLMTEKYTFLVITQIQFYWSPMRSFGQLFEAPLEATLMYCWHWLKLGEGERERWGKDERLFIYWFIFFFFS